MATYLRVPLDNGDRYARLLPVPLTDARVGDFIEDAKVGICAVHSRTWDPTTGDLTLEMLPAKADVDSSRLASSGYAKRTVLAL